MTEKKKELLQHQTFFFLLSIWQKVLMLHSFLFKVFLY